MRDVIRLVRAYAPDGEATLGKLVFPNGWECLTLELPWRENQRRISCIPEGAYSLELVPSPLVTRLSGGKHRQAWEITNVIGRSHILIHQGNYTHNTEGCLLVGSTHTKVDKGWMVTHSVATYELFVQEMGKLTNPYIDIRNKNIGWP